VDEEAFVGLDALVDERNGAGDGATALVENDGVVVVGERKREVADVRLLESVWTLGRTAVEDVRHVVRKDEIVVLRREIRTEENILKNAVREEKRAVRQSRTIQTAHRKSSWHPLGQ
jgi:hypothetical protein